MSVMSDLEKTLKIRAFSPEAKREPAPEVHAKDMGMALELEKKTAQLEEERKKSLECLIVVERQREFIKQEQAKSAELQARVAAAEAKIKDLTQALDRVSSIVNTAMAEAKEG